MEANASNAQDDLARVTFRIDGDAGSFHLPVLVNTDEFEEADLTKVARSLLHHTLAELSEQTERWKLSEEELQRLSSWKAYPGA